MRKILIIYMVTLILFSACKNNPVTIDWVSSSFDTKWEVKQIELETGGVNNSNAIKLFSNEKQQMIKGFGGCFNELGWEALKILPEERKDQIIKSLFDTIGGCKFNFCRMPLGANDYSVGWYSYDEVKDDFGMEHFSIARDKERLIPYIKKAQAYNPKIKIWASPWCPPSWMKTNFHYACNPDVVNDLSESGRGAEMETQFKMDGRYLSSYALYFSKFVEAYRNEGINIYAVHVQNEPNSCQNFPSCVWNPSDLATFIGEYLGPEIRNRNLETEVWLGTVERHQIERIDTILNRPGARKYISGIGFQWDGKGAISKVHEKYPDLELMQTETECGNGSNDWAAAEHTFGLMKYYFNNGANAYMYWNMILDESGKSRWGWKQNSMITVNSQTGQVVYNPEFYVMKHLSYFIKPGAYKIKTSDDSCLAFKNEDSVVLTVYNSGEEEERQFILNDISFTTVLPAKSLNTFKIKI